MKPYSFSKCIYYLRVLLPNLKSFREDTRRLPLFGSHVPSQNCSQTRIPSPVGGSPQPILDRSHSNKREEICVPFPLMALVHEGSHCLGLIICGERKEEEDGRSLSSEEEEVASAKIAQDAPAVLELLLHREG